MKAEWKRAEVGDKTMWRFIVKVFLYPGRATKLVALRTAIALALVPSLAFVSAAGAAPAEHHAKKEFELHDTFAVTSMAWSPDGRHLATATSSLATPAIHIWDVESKTLVRVLKLSAPPPGYHSVSWSGDGKLLAACDVADGGTLRLFSTADWSEVKTLDRTQAGGCVQSAFSSDGKRLATLGTGNGITVLSTETWSTLQSLEVRSGGWFGATGNSIIEYKPNSKSLLISGNQHVGNKPVGRVWLLEDGASTPRLAITAYGSGDTPEGGLMSMAVSADGSQVATGTDDKYGAEETWIVAKTFSLSDGKLLQTPLSNIPKMGRHTASTYLKSGKYLVIANTLNRTIYICDTTSGALVDTVESRDIAWALASHPTNDRFAAASGSDVIVWSVH